MTRARLRRLAVLASLGLALVVGGPVRAEAGDIIAFITLPAPTDTWSRGYGAALTSTWFQVVSLEGEAARLSGEVADNAMTSFTGSVLLAPPVGFLTPYGGFGVGVFRQTVGTLSDYGTMRVFVLGAKVKLGLLVLKGDYRHITISGTSALPMTARISAGAGLSF
jgi:hypothetical protein